MIIPEHEQNDALFYAFRYALGRKSMAVYSVATMVINAWPELSEHVKTRYQYEINEAIEDNMAGMDCDVMLWKKILEL